ncbi:MULTISPECIES: response regulator [unclassified Streptomyces]|uniref:response regulator n=1 Tax=unclassified Streptomyces TaxID=2593676 RepID=UPI00228546B3|nr:response regulator [Streptomyces sp. Je 1-369]WAL99084.1 response regulator [Streptomyces sp. Je 1-369]
MNEAAKLIDALSGLAWPFFAAVIAWRLLPLIEKIVQRGAFTVKYGEYELTVQEVSDKLVETTADIQERLAEVHAPSGDPRPLHEPGGPDEPPSRVLRRVLWVDDRPANNAYEVAQLNALGVHVVQAASTREGAATLFRAAQPFDAVISDMGRDEPTGYNPDAGMDLLHELRTAGETTPFFVYATRRGLTRKAEILAAGGNGVTTSPGGLFDLLRGVGPFPGAGGGAGAERTS